MIKILKSDERGSRIFGWLKALHSFSFGDYYDPENMNFGVLRVINEDRIAPSSGFPMHSHNNMEIITFVISGELKHQDSLGNTSIIKPGEIQRMSAGTGIKHSEFNPSNIQETHLLQIWILADKDGYAPSYAQKSYLNHIQEDKLNLLASNNGRENSISLNQNVNIYLGKGNSVQNFTYEVSDEKKFWLQTISGELFINSQYLQTGDAAAINDLKTLNIETKNKFEFLLFELPK